MTTDEDFNSLYNINDIQNDINNEDLEETSNISDTGKQKDNGIHYIPFDYLQLISYDGVSVTGQIYVQNENDYPIIFRVLVPNNTRFSVDPKYGSIIPSSFISIKVTITPSVRITDLDFFKRNYQILVQTMPSNGSSETSPKNIFSSNKYFNEQVKLWQNKLKTKPRFPEPTDLCDGSEIRESGRSINSYRYSNSKDFQQTRKDDYANKEILERPIDNYKENVKYKPTNKHEGNVKYKSTDDYKPITSLGTMQSTKNIKETRKYSYPKTKRIDELPDNLNSKEKPLDKQKINYSSTKTKLLDESIENLDSNQTFLDKVKVDRNTFSTNDQSTIDAIIQYEPENLRKVTKPIITKPNIVPKTPYQRKTPESSMLSTTKKIDSRFSLTLPPTTELSNDKQKTKETSKPHILVNSKTISGTSEMFQSQIDPSDEVKKGKLGKKNSNSEQVGNIVTTDKAKPEIKYNQPDNEKPEIHYITPDKEKPESHYIKPVDEKPEIHYIPPDNAKPEIHYIKPVDEDDETASEISQTTNITEVLTRSNTTQPVAMMPRRLLSSSSQYTIQEQIKGSHYVIKWKKEKSNPPPKCTYQKIIKNSKNPMTEILVDLIDNRENINYTVKQNQNRDKLLYPDDETFHKLSHQLHDDYDRGDDIANTQFKFIKSLHHTDNSNVNITKDLRGRLPITVTVTEMSLSESTIKPVVLSPQLAILQKGYKHLMESVSRNPYATNPITMTRDYKFTPPGIAFFPSLVKCHNKKCNIFDLDCQYLHKNPILKGYVMENKFKKVNGYTVKTEIKKDVE